MTLHTALVVKQSSVLEKLVGNSMVETQTKTVVWDDLDEATFGLFAQFAYTGDYTPPAFTMEVSRIPSASGLADIVDGVHVKKKTSADIDSLPRDSEESLWGFGGGRSKKGKKGVYQVEEEPTESVQVPVEEPKAVQVPEFDQRGVLKAARKVAPRTRFQDLTFPFPFTYTQHTKICKPRGNQSAEEDYTPVFLGHVRLYVFAHRYDIKPLKALVLTKLHDTLCKFSLYEARFGDILELVRYTYENTESLKLRDPLRELVTHYVAYEAKKVAASEEGLELVGENGPFARDLLSMVL